MARPSMYEDKVKPKLTLIEAWCRDGATDEQIYKKLGISKDTFYKYKKKYKEFSDSLKKGKEIIDVAVENALLRNATGYNYTEQVAFKCKEVYYDTEGRRCESESVRVAEVERHKPAETGAAFIWLKNRKRKVWSDNPQMLEIKKQELELRKQIESTKNW